MILSESENIRQVPCAVTGGIVMRLTLKLNGMDDVKKFTDITSRHEGNIFLMNNGDEVDAKSILGIFSINLSKPVELVCENEDAELLKALAPFIAA